MTLDSRGYQSEAPRVEPDESSVTQLQHFSYQNRPPCYAFRLQGAATRTFGVLSHNGLASVCARVLEEVIPVQSIDNAIRQSYDRFSNHSRTRRFPGKNRTRVMGPLDQILMLIGHRRSVGLETSPPAPIFPGPPTRRWRIRCWLWLFALGLFSRVTPYRLC
jgi:hypothetical protein